MTPVIASRSNCFQPKSLQSGAELSVLEFRLSDLIPHRKKGTKRAALPSWALPDLSTLHLSSALSPSWAPWQVFGVSELPGRKRAGCALEGLPQLQLDLGLDKEHFAFPVTFNPSWSNRCMC